MGGLFIVNTSTYVDDILPSTTTQQPFYGPLDFFQDYPVPGCQHQKGKTNLDFTEARGGKWQWHQLGHMQICTLTQTHNHTRPLSFLEAGCPSCHPTNGVMALKAHCYE